MKIHKFTRLLILLALLAALLYPQGMAAAEAPPPPADPGGGTAPPSSTPANPEPESDEETPTVERISPPLASPEVVVSAVQALYQADGSLTDLNGNPVALASDLAARALVDSDPQGCPPGVLPVSWGGTGAGCTSSYATIAGAIGDALVNTGWTVYVEPGTYVEGPLVINKSITVRGIHSMAATINGWITLGKPNITLRDFTIDGFINSNLQSGTLRLESLTVRAGAGAVGIAINAHNGNVIFNQVDSSYNNQGAVIHQTNPAGLVTILNSNFNNCTGAGIADCLSIQSAGAVRLENVNASLNTHGSGAHVQFARSLTVKNSLFFDNKNGAADAYGYGLVGMDSGTLGVVSLTDLTARNNEENGIYIRTAGNISAKNINTIVNKGSQGMFLQSEKGSVTVDRLLSGGQSTGVGAAVYALGTGPVLVSNAELVSNAYGLYLVSGGNVTLKNIYSQNNSSEAVYLENGSLATAARSVSVTNLKMIGPGSSGMRIYSRGAVTLNHIEATGLSMGALVDNCWDDPDPGLNCRATAGVTLTNSAGQNLFLDTNTMGLQINTAGAISIRGALAKGSAAGFGFYLYNVGGLGNISLSQVEASNNSQGIMAISRGAMTLSKVTTRANTGTGLTLNNVDAPTPKSITITDGEFTANSIGQMLTASGSITLNHVNNSWNSGSAGIVQSVLGSVYITSTSGANHFDHNGNGLLINANAALSLRDATFDHNTGFGLNLLTVRNLTTTLTNITAQGNTGYGININAYGPVTLNRVRAVENSASYGAVIFSVNPAGNYPIVINHGNFSRNAAFGLQITSRGAVTLNHFTAAMNTGGMGLQVDNCDPDPAPPNACRVNRPVSILSSLGRSQFDLNAGDGVHIRTGGSVTLSGISANSNLAGGSGVLLDMAKGTGNLTVTNSQFNFNDIHGLGAVLMGTTLISGVTANANANGSGLIMISGSATSAPKTVTLRNVVFDFNKTNGAQILANGNVSINHISASETTAGNGLVVNTCAGAPCAIKGSVTIANTLGPNLFLSNKSGQGVWIEANGKISLAGVISSFNFGHGALLSNGEATSGVVADVVISGSTFVANTGTGLNLANGSKGLVTISKVIATNNGGVGIDVDNNDAGTGKPVSLSQIQAERNTSTNININSRSTVTLNAIQANFSQSGYGLMVNNYQFGAGSGNVNILNTLGSNSFDNNASSGLYVDTNGHLSVNKATVNNNGVTINADGAMVYLRAANATFYCTAIAANGQNGLQINGLAGQTLTLKGVLLANNDRFGGVADPNLVSGPVTVVLQLTTCP